MKGYHCAMSNILDELNRLDESMRPFLDLRRDMLKQAFQPMPPMPGGPPADPAMAAQQGAPPMDPAMAAQQGAPPMDPAMAAQQGAPPADPNAQAAPPQAAISPEQIGQLLELLQVLAGKVDEHNARLEKVEAISGEHGGALQDLDTRVANAASASLPAAPAK